MPQWKVATPKPGGSLPEGLLNKIMVGLATGLVLALIISVGFCGGGESAADAEDTPPPSTDAVQPGQPVEDELQEAIARQQQTLAAAERAASAAEAQRLLADQRARAAAAATAAAATAAEAAAARTLTPEMRQALFDSLGVLPDPDMIEIQRQAELEAMARRITSVRASPVVLSFRGQRQSAPTGGRETADPPTAGLLDALARGRRVAPGTVQARSPPVESSRSRCPLPSDSPTTTHPPRLLTPADPPGWERVYEGSFLEAVLVNRIEGEFPGPVLASVSVPFYSADRQRVLIPRGTRLIGSSQAVRRGDQGALAVGFHRLIFLDGRHVPLRFIALDQAGSDRAPRPGEQTLPLNVSGRRGRRPLFRPGARRGQPLRRRRRRRSLPPYRLRHGPDRPRHPRPLSQPVARNHHPAGPAPTGLAHLRRAFAETITALKERTAMTRSSSCQRPHRRRYRSARLHRLVARLGHRRAGPLSGLPAAPRPHPGPHDALWLDHLLGSPRHPPRTPPSRTAPAATRVPPHRRTEPP